MTPAGIDRREQIIKRLVELLGADEYIAAKTCVRNRKLTKQDDRPAIAVLDGDERARLTGDNRGRGDHGRIAISPQLMTMQPQVFILPDTQLPQNVTIGTVVNDFRLTIIRVIAQDPVLLGLVGSNGSIAYMSMETDLKSGGTLEGQSRLDFAFTYVLDPY
jgi:hypothetical protein